MHDTIHGGLLSTRTRSLLRASRGVHPYVHALHHVTGQVHVIIREEQYLTQELRVFGDLHYPLDQILTGLIRRVSFPREYKLNRTIRVIHDLIQTIQITEQQMSSFIGSKTTGKTDCQYVIPQSVLNLHDLSRCEISRTLLVSQTMFYMTDQATS